MAFGAAGVDRAWRMGVLEPRYRPPQAALMILPERRHLVQTRTRLTPPLTTARTVWRFGSNRRGVTLWAWLMLRPTTGPLPQISQRLAMSCPFAKQAFSAPDRNPHYTIP